MKSSVWTKLQYNRRGFIGGSDARIIMGSDEAALIHLWREKQLSRRGRYRAFGRRLRTRVAAGAQQVQELSISHRHCRSRELHRLMMRVKEQARRLIRDRCRVGRELAGKFAKSRMDRRRCEIGIVDKLLYAFG